MSLTISIIETISPDRFLIQCGNCSGSGRMARDLDGKAPFRVCTVCEGKGTVILVADDKTLLQCGLCNGSGSHSRDLDGKPPMRLCTVCAGVGAVPATGKARILC